MKIPTSRGELIEILRFIKTTDFDTSTPDGRTRERNRRIILNSIASVFARVAVAGVVYVYKTSEEDFAKHAKRSAKKKGKNSATSEPAPPVEVEFPGETKKPRPVRAGLCNI